MADTDEVLPDDGQTVTDPNPPSLQTCPTCGVVGCDGFTCRPKPEPWTRKRKRTKKKTTKRHGLVGRKWTWNILNTFQKTSKWTVRGRLIRPTLRNTIPGCIYYAMKRIKRGTDARVHAAACADGLELLTIQPTFRRVQAELRLLAKLKIIKRVSHKRRRRTT